MQYINLHIPTHYLTDSICPPFLWKRENTCNFRPKTWGRLSSEFFLLTSVLNSRWCNNSRFTEVSCCALPSSKVSLWGLFPPVFLVLGGILLFYFSNQIDCCFCSMSSNTKSTLRDKYLQQSQGWGTSHHLGSNNWELHSHFAFFKYQQFLFLSTMHIPVKARIVLMQFRDHRKTFTEPERFYYSV